MYRYVCMHVCVHASCKNACMHVCMHLCDKYACWSQMNKNTLTIQNFAIILSISFSYYRCFKSWDIIHVIDIHFDIILILFGQIPWITMTEVAINI